MADLHIPDAALDALLEAAADPDFQERDHSAVVQAIAAPVVAAELRALADGVVADASDAPRPGSEAQRHLNWVHGRLVARADELDPPQSGGDH